MKPVSQNTLSVLYCITKLELGGAQKVCLALFEELEKQNHTSLLMSGAEGYFVPHLKHTSHVYLLPTFRREVSHTALLAELKNFFYVTQHLRKLKKKYPNLIIHTHSTKAGLVGRWAAFFAGIQCRIHTIHGYAFHNYQSWLRWFSIYCLELITSLITTHYVCVSSADVATGIKLFPYFKKKYSIIRASVALEEFCPIQPSNKKTQNKQCIVGTIGCFKEQKNLSDLILAFASAYKKNNALRLEIIGDGILRPDLEALLVACDLSAVTTLHGWQHTVAPFMRTWDMFALTSLWEGLPCAIIEARSLKLPVIAYDTGGIADVIVHNKNGLLYQQKDLEGFTHGILELSCNQNLYARLQAYNDDLTDFNYTVMITKHIELYRSLT